MSGVWVAASTHQFKEPVAVTNLERQGFEAYCPMIRRRIRHARKLREVQRPLFPGYVFIRLDLKYDRWRPILSTVGVRSLIQFGGKLGILPRGFVSTLRSREEDGTVAFPRARDSYTIGERVRLREGPFEGLIATVLRCDESSRLTLLLDLLRRSVCVRARLDHVGPA